MYISAQPKIVLAFGFEMLPKSLQKIILHPVLCILECLYFVSEKSKKYTVSFSNALCWCNCVLLSSVYSLLLTQNVQAGPKKLNSCI